MRVDVDWSYLNGGGFASPMVTPGMTPAQQQQVVDMQSQLASVTANRNRLRAAASATPNRQLQQNLSNAQRQISELTRRVQSATPSRDAGLTARSNQLTANLQTVTRNRNELARIVASQERNRKKGLENSDKFEELMERYKYLEAQLEQARAAAANAGRNSVRLFNTPPLNVSRASPVYDAPVEVLQQNVAAINAQRQAEVLTAQAAAAAAASQQLHQEAAQDEQIVAVAQAQQAQANRRNSDPEDLPALIIPTGTIEGRTASSNSNDFFNAPTGSSTPTAEVVQAVVNAKKEHTNQLINHVHANTQLQQNVPALAAAAARAETVLTSTHQNANLIALNKNDVPGLVTPTVPGNNQAGLVNASVARAANELQQAISTGQQSGAQVEQNGNRINSAALQVLQVGSPAQIQQVANASAQSADAKHAAADEKAKEAQQLQQQANQIQINAGVTPPDRPVGLTPNVNSSIGVQLQAVRNKALDLHEQVVAAAETIAQVPASSASQEKVQNTVLAAKAAVKDTLAKVNAGNLAGAMGAVAVLQNHTDATQNIVTNNPTVRAVTIANSAANIAQITGNRQAKELANDAIEVASGEGEPSNPVIERLQQEQSNVIKKSGLAAYLTARGKIKSPELQEYTAKVNAAIDSGNQATINSLVTDPQWSNLRKLLFVQSTARGARSGTRRPDIKMGKANITKNPTALFGIQGLEKYVPLRQRYA